MELAWIWGEDQRNPLKVQDVQFWYTVAQRPFNIYFLTQVEKEKDCERQTRLLPVWRSFVSWGIKVKAPGFEPWVCHDLYMILGKLTPL